MPTPLSFARRTSVSVAKAQLWSRGVTAHFSLESRPGRTAAASLARHGISTVLMFLGRPR